MRAAVGAAVVLAAVVGAAGGCDPPAPAAAARAMTTTTTTTTTTVGDGPRGTGVRFEHAAEGEVATQVRALLARERLAGRAVLVYVGASWCEPCQYFHRAAERGELDAAFPALTLLEFDLDRDADRLAAGGYVSRMIPLFTVPGADGRATERHIEGSIHGPGAVGEIAPRLRALLAPTAVP